MELISNKTWNIRRRGYNKLSSSSKGKRNIKTVRFRSSSSGSKKRSSWRIRIVPKLRVAASPAKLWRRFKNAYVKMMLKFANTVGTSNSANMFGDRRIPKARDDDHVDMSYTRTEFENRLILEIYKSMVSSLELGNYKK